MLNKWLNTPFLQLPICKSHPRMGVLHGWFLKLPASPGREQNKAWAHSRGGLPNKLVFSFKS